MRYFLLPLCLLLSLNSFSLAAVADTARTHQSTAKAKPVLTLKPNATEGYAQTMREPRAPNASGSKVNQVSPPAITFRGKDKELAPPSEAFLVK